MAIRPGNCLGKMTVLVVDDNAGVRRLLCMMLSGVASQIWEAADGSEGVRRFEECRPGVVLMDIRMPGMDGLAATREIVRLHPKAKVWILTDQEHEDMQSAAREAGACAFISKQDLTDLPNLLRADQA